VAREAWLLDGARTPRGKGKPGGALHELHPQELLGPAGAFFQRCWRAIGSEADLVVEAHSRLVAVQYGQNHSLDTF